MKRFRELSRPVRVLVLSLSCLSVGALPGSADSQPTRAGAGQEKCWEKLKDDLRDCLSNFCIRQADGSFECNPAFDPCAQAALSAYRYCRLGR